MIDDASPPIIILLITTRTFYGEQRMKKLYPYLAYAGTLPFIACASYLLFNKVQFPILGSIEKVLSVYALVIASFLAGAHWGQHLHLDGKWSRILPISSNIIVVTLWLAFLMLPFKILLSLFIAAFFLLLLIDYYLFKKNVITLSYFKTRCYATAIVILTLIISRIAS